MNSVLNQTMPATEIIVVHDGCEPAPVYKDTVTVYRKENKGVARARMEGALLATSEYLLFLDGDDCLSENYIQAMIGNKAKSGADVIYPNVLLWCNWSKAERLQNRWFEAPDNISPKKFLNQCPIVVTSLISKDMFFKAGGFPTKLGLFEDWYFWLKIASLGAKFKKEKMAVLKYRQRRTGRNMGGTYRDYYFNFIREAFEIKNGVICERKSI